MATISFLLLSTCLVIQQSGCMQEQLSALANTLYNRMVADITPCQGTQKELNQLSFRELRNPHDSCTRECSNDGLTYVQGSFKYSGSNVLCCCGPQVDNHK